MLCSLAIPDPEIHLESDFFHLNNFVLFVIRVLPE